MTASKNLKVREAGSRRRRRDLSWRGFGVSSVVFAVVLACLLYSVYGLRPDSLLVVGAPSPQTFLAPQGLSVTDEVATARERQAARTQVGTIYSSVPELQELVLDEIARSPVPPRVKRFLTTAYERPQGVSERGLELLIAEAAALVSEAERPRVRRVLAERLLPSAEPNARSSEAARVAAAASVAPVLRSLEAGEVIVARGEPLSENTLSVLESVGLYNPFEEVLEQGVRLGVTSVLLALLLSLPLVYFYTALRGSTTVGQRSFLALLWAAALVAQRSALLADTHFLFIAFLPLLGAVLFGERLAFVLAVWLGVVTAFLTPGSSFATLLALLAGGTVAVLLARVFRTRATLLLAGLASGVAGALAFAVYTALSGGFGTLAMAVSLAWLLGGGVLAGILALAALPLTESNLGFLTEFRLLELTSPSNPLLQKLLLEAPGSYQHSLIISNLVEQAVKNIGGDALLARVGALVPRRRQTQTAPIFYRKPVCRG